MSKVLLPQSTGVVLPRLAASEWAWSSDGTRLPDSPHQTTIFLARAPSRRRDDASLQQISRKSSLIHIAYSTAYTGARSNAA